MPFILGTNSIKDTGYNVDNSLRFNKASGDYLNRAQGTPTSRRTFTYSGWIKISELNIYNILFESANGSHNFQMVIQNDGNGNDFRVYDYDGSTNLSLRTTQAFRDVSAWYHIVLAVDTTQSTASNRVKLYVNGTRVTAFDTETYMDQNYDTAFANGVNMQIGRQQSASDYFQGYMCEVVFIDGSQLAADSFGEFDEDSGIWKPIDVSGLTFGNNGFYQEYKQSGTGTNSSGLGADTSGNDNHFAVNNLTGVDQSTDTCTNNFATMNPLSAHGSVTLAEGNLQVNVADNTDNDTSSFMVSSGKWYWEGKYTVGSLAMVGIRPEGMNVSQDNLFNLTGALQGYYYYADSGNQRPANTSYGASFTTNDIIGFALDLDSGTQTITFYKNGASQGAINIATSGLTWGFSFTSGGGSDTFQMNFGSPPYSESGGNSDGNGYGNFSMSVPSGHYALNSKNLAEYG